MQTVMHNRAIVIEDEPESLQNMLNQLATYCPDVEVVATGGSNADFLRLVDKYEGQFEVAILDIQLTDGLVFNALKELDEPPFDIIFVTAYDKYAQRAFDFAAIHYVLKPIEGNDLMKAVSRIRHRNTETKQRLEILQQNYNPSAPNAFEKIGISALDGIHFVRLRDIIRLEAEDNYTHFLMIGGERITASRTIKAFEETMVNLGFVRVHKSHIVNMNYMKTYVKGEGGYLVLESGETVEVARRKKSTLIDAVRRGQGNF